MKILIIIITLLSFSKVCAQDYRQTKVALKSGVEISGQLISFIPNDSVILKVAGIRSAIPFSDVASIIECGQENKELPSAEEKLVYGKFEKLDTEEYIDSFVVKIGGQSLTMILIRGGVFNMGYDGRGSLSMNSEPVHRVVLSSYYISKEYINKSAVKFVQKGKVSKQFAPYMFYDQSEVGKIIKKIKEMIGGDYRLPTEAEWEYAALTATHNLFLKSNKYTEYEICSDFFCEEYPKGESKDPQGPLTGKKQVIRQYSKDRKLWKRYRTTPFKEGIFARLAISADKIKKNKT